MTPLAKSAAAALAFAASLGVLTAQQSPFNEHDDYTEYQLLDPASHQFHIIYFLNQRQAGATTLLNQTRSGSEGSDISVSDPRTGEPLKFEYKTGAEIAASGESGRLNATEHYIRAFLPRPVPEGGEGRVRIEKTYLDEKSYYSQGDEIVFARSLGIGRNAILLPAGYAIASSNVAGQVITNAAGRVKVAFENSNRYAADVQIHARRSAIAPTPSAGVVERGFDFSKTLFDLGDPAAHRIAVRHEFVAAAPGRRIAVPLLSRVAMSDAAATDLDTGEPMKISTTSGAPGIDLAAPMTNPAQSVHVRVQGTRIDPAYTVSGDQLVWSITLNEPRTTILLPAGWEVTTATSATLVSTTREGRVALQVYNPRVEAVTLSIRATRPK